MKKSLSRPPVDLCLFFFSLLFLPILFIRAKRCSLSLVLLLSPGYDFLGCTMSLVSGSSIAPLLQGLDRQYVYIAGTAIMVCMLVAAVLFLSSQKKEKLDSNRGIFSYLKFFYATFLKPHEKGDGQQDALESFYRTQVCP